MGETGMKRYSEYRFGDMLATWWLDRENHMGMTLIPADMKNRVKDSLRRINYSLVNTFLGVMCLSGDIHELSAEQWARVDEGISFFKAVRRIIRDGVSAFHGEISGSWRHPEGWQAICRTAGDETLAVIHTFAGNYPETIRLPVTGRRILRAMSSENNRITLENGVLTVELKADFEAIAVHVGS